MQKEVQIHLDNRGQINYKQEIDDVNKWLEEKASCHSFIIHDTDEGKHYYVNMSFVTAILVMDVPTQSTPDPDKQFNEGIFNH